MLEPLLIRARRRKEFVMPLDCQARVTKDLRKPLAEIAIGKVTPVQAARSYRTACSISAEVKP